MTDEEPRWTPTPVPALPLNPDGTMPDVTMIMNEDMRVAIFRRLQECFTIDRHFTPEQARQLAQFGAAAVMALAHEMAVLKQLGGGE